MFTIASSASLLARPLFVFACLLALVSAAPAKGQERHLEILRIDTLRSVTLYKILPTSKLTEVRAEISSVRKDLSSAERRSNTARLSVSQRNQARAEAERLKRTLQTLRTREHALANQTIPHTYHVVRAWDGFKHEFVSIWIHDMSKPPERLRPGAFIVTELKTKRLPSLRSVAGNTATSTISSISVFSNSRSIRYVAQPREGFREYRFVEKTHPRRRIEPLSDLSGLRGSITASKNPEITELNVSLMFSPSISVASFTFHLWALDEDGKRTVRLTDDDGIVESSPYGMTRRSTFFDPGRRFVHGFAVEFTEAQVYVTP